MTEAAAPRGGDVRGRIALRAPHVAPAPLGPSHVESRVRCAFDRARKGGYHSNQSMVDLEAVGIRSCIAEPDRGRRDWSKEPDAQRPVYRNRRRMRGPRGRRLRGNAASGATARWRISTTPVACGARICVVTRTFSSGC